MRAVKQTLLFFTAVCALVLLLAAIAAGPCRAQCSPELVSVSVSGQPGNGSSNYPSISADSRFVAFHSWATDLVAGDTNGALDVFVRDRLTRTTERVSLSSGGQQANAGSGDPAVSADGRFVAFSSAASNLVANDTNNQSDVFVRDRVAGATELVSVSSAGEQTNGISYADDISGDGRFVAFMSAATNLVPEDTNGKWDVFVHDRETGETTRVSISTLGEEANGGSDRGRLSADGRHAAFESAATNLVPDDTNGVSDIFVHDCETGETTRASVTTDGSQFQAPAYYPDISGDGGIVVFMSAKELFVRDRTAGETFSLGQVDGLDWDSPPAISPDGRYVAKNYWWIQYRNEYVGINIYDIQTRSPVYGAGDWAREPSLAGGARSLAFTDGRGSRSDVFVCDRIHPYLERFAINSGAVCADSRSVTLAYSCAGGCVQVRFRNEGEDWSAWEPCTGTKAWTLSAGGGWGKRVFAQCRDAVGFESGEGFDEIRLASFEDVTCSNPAFRYVEALVRVGITTGCSPNPPLYCPYNNITRAQMAVFLCKAAGKDPLDRATPTFCDVPKTSPYYGWIERLADAASWGGNPPTIGCLWFPCRKFCPFTAVLRDQMAAFLVRATGKTPMPSCSRVFADVSPSSWACPYIERAADPASWPTSVAVTSGCACPSGYPQGSKCYCPKSLVTRGQMAVFLVRAFGIPL